MSDREISLAILEELRALRRERPKSSKPTARDLGLISNEDFCEALKISRWTAATLRKTDKLRYCKLGGRIYYKLSDVEEMIQKHFPRT